MLRPERMSKVSVTGSKAVMESVIETVHDLNLVHVSEYDGSWEGFEQGDPMAGAEEASDKLVTVRSIESILDVDGEDAGPSRIVTDEALEEELTEVRERVNELDDRRDEIRDELREVEEELESVQPFVELGIDLDLLSGYDSLEVAVGEGDESDIESELAHADDIRRFDTFTGGSIVAVFGQPAEGTDEGALADALVGAEFAAVEVPEVEGTPEEYVQELEHRKQQLRSELNTVEDDIEELKHEFAGFLLAAEETLSIDVQKTEAPLSFATTENAFIAEGWIPTERYGEFADALDRSVGDRVEVEELERAEFTSAGDAHHEAVADGGTAMGEEDPPVVQDNNALVAPFEVLVEAVSRPSYDEFDPTALVFLTFPVFFGFMIGDLGYGLLYTAIGYYLYSNFDSRGMKSMGGVTITAGLFTMLFGILYGEIFGTHQVTAIFWEGMLGWKHPPIEKGLSPAAVEWAKAWLVVSVLAGIAHLNMAWIVDFVENTQIHDLKHAVYESASWILMMNGLWVWVFSTSASGMKPGFLVGPQSAFNGHPFGLGFAGFPATVGLIGGAVFAVGLLLLILGEPIEAVEFLNVLVNVLSYTRIAAVLLAKAGMAFTVNLLFFGAYEHEGVFHFMIDHNKAYVIDHYGREAIMFGGLANGGIAFFLLGIVVLLVGHALVLTLGVTSAGLQAVRLEYVEFFGKFYEGGGRAYEPFGYERRFTQDE